MDKKIVLLKDLNYISSYPVVDILTSEGSRLGCATTSLINWTMRLGIFNPNKFSNPAEMALHYESLFETDEFKGVRLQKFYQIVDEYLKENNELLETYIFRADTLPLEFVLFFLKNDFTALIASQNTANEGHGDILFRENKKVFYNCLEINEEDLCKILYSSSQNMVVFGRNLKFHNRLMMKATDLGNITRRLNEDEKYMLTKREIFFVENNLKDILLKYPGLSEIEALEEKEITLKALGYIDKELIILFKGKGTP